MDVRGKIFIVPVKMLIIAFVLFVELKGLGIFSKGGFGSGNFNLLAISQIITILILVFFLFGIKFNTYLNTGNVIQFPTILIFSIFMIGILKSIFDFFILKNLSFGELYYNIKYVHVYLLFFLLLALIKTEDDILKLYDLIIFLSVVGSIFIIFVAITHINTGTIIIREGDVDIRRLRILSPTGTFIAFGFYLKFTEIWKTKSITIYSFLIILLLAIGVLIQMHRSVLLAFFGSFFIYFFIFELKQILKGKIGKILFALFGITVIVIIVNLFIPGRFNIIELIHSSLSDEKSGSGTFTFRIRVLINTLNYIIENKLLFGIGFSWHITEFIDYWNTSFSLSPTNDNSITNVLLVFGIPGILVYIMLFYRIFRFWIKIKRKLENTRNNIPYMGIILSFLYIVITLFFSDNLMGFTHTVTFIIIWSISYRMNDIIIKKET